MLPHYSLHPLRRPQAASSEEREHAELLMEYQNKRGGRVRLASILMPEKEFNHAEKVRRQKGLCFARKGSRAELANLCRAGTGS